MARPWPRSPARGRSIVARASPQGRPTSLSGATARKGLSLARTAMPAVRVTTPWQGGYRRARAATIYAGAVVATAQMGEKRMILPL
ncbi:hypothetical protein GW17_00041462 [Ensete ventricosum]|nr:hypothetical protein GW17_00041462 [Ensete ventricosum]